MEFKVEIFAGLEKSGKWSEVWKSLENYESDLEKIAFHYTG